jgi:amino acid transporter
MVDPALGVAVGWNHFVSKARPISTFWLMSTLQFAQTSYVIFEATVINTLVEYWGYNQSPAILISSMVPSEDHYERILTLFSVSLVLYLAINVYRADLFGEAECRLSSYLWLNSFI